MYWLVQRTVTRAADCETACVTSRFVQPMNLCCDCDIFRILCDTITLFRNVNLLQIVHDANA